MNRSEVTGMLTYFDRLGLLAYKPGAEDAWFDVVSHIASEDARAAARVLATEGLPDGRFSVRPSDVTQVVDRLRSERVRAALGGAEPVPPREISPDDVGAYQAWRKAFLRSLGDGKTVHDAEVDACGAAGVPVVHRAIEAHQVPQFRRLEAR